MIVEFIRIRLKKRFSGFSLIETLISLLILLIALLSLSKMPAMTTKLMVTSIHHEEANLIVQRELELLEGCSFDSAILSGDHSFEYALDGVSRDFFDCSYSVNPVFNDNAKLVNIVVSWNGGEREVKVSRIFSRFARRTVADDAR